MVGNSHKKSKLQSETTRVGFGRTDLSFGANGATFRDLSHVHGFRGPCFQGVSSLGRLVHPLPAVWTVSMKKKSSDFHDAFDRFWIVFLNGFHEHDKRTFSNFVFSG